MSSMASALLNGVTSQAYTSSSGTATPPQQSVTSSMTSPLTFASNIASLTSTLHSHALTFALFTSKSDIVTRQVQTAFEQIAQEEKQRRRAAGGKGVDLAFVEVDVDMPTGKEVASKYGVVDTPGYAFFKGDEKVGFHAKTGGRAERWLMMASRLCSLDRRPRRNCARLSGNRSRNSSTAHEIRSAGCSAQVVIIKPPTTR